MLLYSNDLIYIEHHPSSIPWVKLFTHIPHREFSYSSQEEKAMIWESLDQIERLMLTYFHPTKINIASFGNMLPRLHWHIMARFAEDDFFPEPMWGVQQREGFHLTEPLEPFFQQLHTELSSRFS